MSKATSNEPQLRALVERLGVDAIVMMSGRGDPCHRQADRADGLILLSPSPGHPNRQS
jgi:hypothetical protein